MNASLVMSQQSKSIYIQLQKYKPIIDLRSPAVLLATISFKKMVLRQRFIIIQFVIIYPMTTSAHNIKRSTENSNNIDFIPPSPTYIQNEQFNSAFFRDHNEEQYQIQRAFKANNFTYLRSNIPNQIKRGAILQQRLQKVQQSTQNEAANRQKPYEQKEQQRKERATKKKMEQIGQLGYFQVFPYQQSLYGLEHQYQIREKEKGKQLQEQISMLDFRPAGFDKKMKYQNPFSYIDRIQTPDLQKQEYIYPFHIPQDTFDRFHQSELRTRIINQANKIAGQFIPSKNEKSLSKVNRSKAVDIIKEVEVFLKRYLPTVGFFIGINKKDHIDVLFEQSNFDNTKLHLLMSRICETEELSKYLLRRNATKWGKIGENGYLQFTILPPWVKETQQKLSRE